MQQTIRDDKGIFEALIGDGRPFLIFTGLCLVLAARSLPLGRSIQGISASVI
jgi:hypothetical protein